MITLKTNKSINKHISQLEKYMLKLEELKERDLSKERLDIELGIMNQNFYNEIFDNFQTFENFSKEEVLYALKDYISYQECLDEPTTSWNIVNNLMEIVQEDGTVGYNIYDVDNKMLVELAENNTMDERLYEILEDDIEDTINLHVKNNIDKYINEPENQSLPLSEYINGLKSKLYMEKAFDYHITNELSSLADNMEHKYNIAEEIIESIDSDNIRLGHLKIIANEIASDLEKDIVYDKTEIVNDLELDYKQIKDKQEER